MDELSVYIISNMNSMPSLCMEVMRLTGLTRAKFLHATLQYVLPSLLANGDRETVKAVAKVLQTDEKSMCMDHIVPILHACLLQDDKSRAAFVKVLSSLFGANAFTQMLRSYLPQTLGNLVVSLGHEHRHLSVSVRSNFLCTQF